VEVHRFEHVDDGVELLARARIVAGEERDALREARGGIP
jgi:hypothetical protein